MGGKLRRAGEGQAPPTGKLDESARQPIRAEGFIDVERGDEASRLRAEDIARGQNGVAADIVKPAAAERLVADVSASVSR